MWNVSMDRVGWKGLLAGVLGLTMPLVLLFVGPLAIRNSPWSPPPKKVFPRTHIERLVGEFRESNNSFGDTPIYVDMTLFVDVPVARQNELESVLSESQGDVRSAVASLLRSVPYQDLREPSLTTLKRKMKVAMIQASGQETTLFDELVIPDFEATQIN